MSGGGVEGRERWACKLVVLWGRSTLTRRATRVREWHGRDPPPQAVRTAFDSSPSIKGLATLRTLVQKNILIKFPSSIKFYVTSNCIFAAPPRATHYPRTSLIPVSWNGPRRSVPDVGTLYSIVGWAFRWQQQKQSEGADYAKTVAGDDKCCVERRCTCIRGQRSRPLLNLLKVFPTVPGKDSLTWPTHFRIEQSRGHRVHQMQHPT